MFLKKIIFIFHLFWWGFLYLIPLKEWFQWYVNLFSLFLTVFKLKEVIVWGIQFQIIWKFFYFKQFWCFFHFFHLILIRVFIWFWSGFFQIIPYEQYNKGNTSFEDNGVKMIQSYYWVQHFTVSSTLLCRAKYCIHTNPKVHLFICSPFTCQHVMVYHASLWSTSVVHV